MAAPVTRLVTFVDIDDHATKNTFSVSARLELELATGSRVLLLGDRGWTSSGPPNIWAHITIHEVIDTARTVVGPDEPSDGRSQGDMETEHWADLQLAARKHSVTVTAAALQRLPHDVEFSSRLRKRLTG